MKEYYNKDDIKIYNADNLELLKNLESNSINLIYSDILYNTGKTFDDYNDNLGTPEEAVEWYRPRIEEMKRVLTDNGSIFIHCNWRLDSYIRILMDEIFGRNNFRNRIYRKHSKERGFYSNFDSQVDIILYYVKDTNNFVFNEIEEETMKVFPLYENGYVEGRSEPIEINGEVIDLKSKNKHWLVNKKFIDKINSNGQLLISQSLPYRKTYSKVIGNLWTSDEMLDDYSRNKLAEAYDTPKPLAILERIINICSNEGDTVADFFLGGGSTAVVTKQMNRKGIFCDINKKACDVTIEKLENLK